MARPKAKPRHGMESQAVQPVSLSLGSKRLLCNYAGLRLEHAQEGQAATDAERMLRAVEDVLALWPGLEEELDQAPTPKECAAALRPVEKHAEALRRALAALDARSHGLLEQPPTRLAEREAGDPLFAQRFDIEAFRRALSLLWVRAHSGARELQSQSEAGKQPRRALGFVVEQLAREFASAIAIRQLADFDRRVCVGPSGAKIEYDVPDDPFGASDPDRRLEFVKVALAAGGIATDGFSVKDYLTHLDADQDDDEPEVIL